MVSIYDKVKQLPRNHLDVLYVIQRKGPIAKATILELTKIKISKLNRILQKLEDMRLIMQTGEGKSTGGRKPQLFDVTRNNYYIFGLSIGSVRYTLTLVNLKMEVITTIKGNTFKNTLPRNFLNMISSSIQSILENNHISREKVVGIGIGHSSKVEIDSGRLLCINSLSVNEEWLNFYTRDEFQRATGFHTLVDYNIDCVGLALAHYGEAVGHHKFILLSCATTIRCALINDGIPVFQDRIADDSFGHMTIDMDGRLCRCGNYGCLESYASLTSMREQFLSALKMGRRTIICNIAESGPTIEQLEDAVLDGDTLAAEILHQGAFSLGVGIANFVNLFNPDIVILSGLLSEKSSTYCDIARDTALKRLSNFCNNPTITITRTIDESLSFSLGSCVNFFERWIYPNKFINN